jgi:hypothetical protein
VNSLCIYEWKSWHGFLLPMMFPDATRVRARPGESAADVLRRLPPDAGTFAFHVNLTDTRRIPLRRSQFCRSLHARGIRVLNEGVTDISKHHLQDVCAQAGLRTTRAQKSGDPDELLIVKTNANYAGEKEKFLTAQQRRALRLLPANRWIKRHDEYLIQPRRDVRPEHWQSRQLIIERFIENRRHVFYRAHKLGNQLIVSRMVNPAGIKKMLQQIRRTNWYLTLPSLNPVQGPRPHPAHVISAVARIGSALMLDLGSIDLLEDNDGRCYVVDVNASPFWGETGYDHMLRFLAEGVD